VKWNLREKLEAARSEERVAAGLPSDEHSPWIVEGSTAVDPRPTPAGDVDTLPVWTGARTGISALVAEAPLPERKASAEGTVTSLVREGDRCRACGGTVHTDIVDLVGGATHLSCRECGLRYHNTAI